MVTLTFEVKGEKPGELLFPVKRVLNGGFAGRDQSQVRAHIEELKHFVP